MTPSEQELFANLISWQIDRPDNTLTFCKRLARENGWSHTYSGKVVEEYKKFIFLAAKAGHPVTPSDAVDQAWHLHLTYTKSYWEGLCEGILQQKLHHYPTKGGKQEDHKFGDWYEMTLTSYQHFFGIVPPASIWPPVSERFKATTQFKRIDISKVWLLPKPTLSVRLYSFMLITLLCAVLIGCTGDLVATGLIIGSAATGLIVCIIIYLTLSIPKTSTSRQMHRRKRNTAHSDSSSSDSSSSDLSNTSAGAGSGFEGFGGGLFGGGGAGGNYSDDSSSSDGTNDSGGDSGCGSGCGGGD